MTQNEYSKKQDRDFAIGLYIIIIAWVASVWNLAVAFVWMDVGAMLFAVICFFWFLFAPIYFSKQLDVCQWTFSKWGNSIWSTMVWRKEYP